MIKRTSPTSPTNPHGSVNQPTLVLSSSLENSNAVSKILATAREREWNVLDLSLTLGQVPKSIAPRLAVVTADATDNLLCRLLRGMGCGIVRLGNVPHPMGTTGDPAVLDDFPEEGRLAAEHFAERDLRAVGYPVWTEEAPRFQAFRTRATELGCTCHPLLFKPSQQRRHESEAKFRERRYALMLEEFRKWAHDIPRPIGLACPTDILAARYTHLAIHHGFRVPHDIAILGRGDQFNICEGAPVRISSIRINEHGRIAALFRLLDDLLAGHALPTEPILIQPDGITLRASTDMRAARDLRISKALQFIWSHYDDVNLSVDRVADAVGFSRRKLEYLFRAELDKTINAILLERRMERCRYLLITTDTTVTDLCRHVGFISKEHLHRVFKHVHGMTPRQYRQSQQGSSLKPPHI